MQQQEHEQWVAQHHENVKGLKQWNEDWERDARLRAEEGMVEGGLREAPVGAMVADWAQVWACRRVRANSTALRGIQAPQPEPWQLCLRSDHRTPAG